ncbi:MAG: TrbC/VirB2 family protein [Chloroflexota bacterium]|nr:TrbC/VirB2 family protein [Chloroflexota bacterium]
MSTRPKRIATAVLALAPAIAHAQAIGGGGGGILAGAVQYFETNIAADLGTLAVICVGLFMLSMRISWLVIIGVAAGIEVIFNAQTIAGALHL